MSEINNVMVRFVDLIIQPLINVIFAAGFFLFLWGLVVFLWKLNSGADNKQEKDHMLWGIVGMLIMVSVGGILGLIENTFGLDSPDAFQSQDMSPGFQFDAR